MFKTADGKNLEGVATSNFLFNILSKGRAKRSSLPYSQHLILPLIKQLAQTNNAEIDYEPAIVQGLEAYISMESEKGRGYSSTEGVYVKATSSA